MKTYYLWSWRSSFVCMMIIASYDDIIISYDDNHYFWWSSCLLYHGILRLDSSNMCLIAKPQDVFSGIQMLLFRTYLGFGRSIFTCSLKITACVTVNYGKLSLLLLVPLKLPYFLGTSWKKTHRKFCRWTDLGEFSGDRMVGKSLVLQMPWDSKVAPPCLNTEWVEWVNDCPTGATSRLKIWILEKLKIVEVLNTCSWSQNSGPV